MLWDVYRKAFLRDRKKIKSVQCLSSRLDNWVFSFSAIENMGTDQNGKMVS